MRAGAPLAGGANAFSDQGVNWFKQNTWNCAILSYDGSSFTLSVSGDLNVSSPVEISLTHSGTPNGTLYLMGNRSHSGFTHGAQLSATQGSSSRVQVYARTLTASETTQIRAAAPDFSSLGDSFFNSMETTSGAQTYPACLPSGSWSVTYWVKTNLSSNDIPITPYILDASSGDDCWSYLFPNIPTGLGGNSGWVGLGARQGSTTEGWYGASAGWWNHNVWTLLILSNNSGSLTLTIQNQVSNAPISVTKAIVSGTVLSGDLSVHAQSTMSGSINFSSSQASTSKFQVYARAPLTSSEITTILADAP